MRGYVLRNDFAQKDALCSHLPSYPSENMEKSKGPETAGEKKSRWRIGFAKQSQSFTMEWLCEAKPIH